MLKFKTKLSYGVGGISDNALYTLTGTYLLLYLTTVCGINATVAGTISAIGSIWEAIVAPIFGFKSDNTISRYGKRKPFILIAAVPLFVVTSLLFTSINLPPVIKTIYYGLLIVLFWTFFSCEFIPYLSWGADLTEDYHERTVLRSFSFVFNQIGMLIGMVLPTVILDISLNMGKTTETAWSYIGMFTGGFAMASLLICALTIKITDVKDFIKSKEKKPLVDFTEIKKILKEYKKIITLKPLLFLVGASLLYLVADVIFSSSRVFYMTYNLGRDEKFISLMMLVIALAGLLFVPFVTKFSKWFDKKYVFMFGIGVSGILLILCRYIELPVVISCILFSLANTCYWQLMPSMMYDVCLVEELKHKESHSGTVISLQALSESLSIALGVQGLGIILDLSGFNESSLVQTENALSWVSNSFTLIPGIFMVLVFIAMLFYPINKKTFARVSTEIAKLRDGKEVDLAGIEKLVR